MKFSWDSERAKDCTKHLGTESRQKEWQDHNDAVAAIADILAGRDPANIGAILAQCMAMYIAGFPDHVQRSRFDRTVKLIEDMLPVMAALAALEEQENGNA